MGGSVQKDKIFLALAVREERNCLRNSRRALEGPEAAAHEGTLGDSAVRPRLQPGSINWALKREKRLTVTKSEGHKNVANADSTEFQKASPLQQLQAPVEMGTRLQGLSLGGTRV